MAVLCIILDEDDKNEVQGGPEKGYLNNAYLMPIQRLGGTSGNPNRCYILNSTILSNPDFASAHSYLSGLTQKESTSSGFPPELPDNS